ncbi:DUF1221 domain-containing protein/Pkinase_Tyr domain-containing protein [Cephalotus follicularis]|uniref:DUF1221 domain-containing protein/Pkinase_Tyr domain-containing protein n=1 Tax=Cephalotus follicularis TaxID=3775 RepID=A0A1Q3B6Q5_CEPFO|nr:DUF1221 domain-containing protein/Pkinase_Tyr domain-containing protein [Cephalotus follicularis]
MEQFRQIGEVLGSLKALMVLQDDIQINQRQCCLLLDIFCLAFDTIAEEIRQCLKLEEKDTKWKDLEQPLRELQCVFKGGELYVRRCLDRKNWWGKAISLHQNKDCVEFHIHNLLNYFPAVIEAIETAGEISGIDQEEMNRRKVALGRKYDKEWNELKLFQFRFGKQYLITRETCNRFETAWREDKWRLVEALKEKRSLGSALTKSERRLADLLIKKINGLENGKLFPSSVLVEAPDYQVKRRLGAGNQYKEIQWMGEHFAMRHFFGEIETFTSEISTLLSLSHPNILQYLCGFYEEEKKECFLVMELMSKDLLCYMKENCALRRRILFSLPVVVDVMLQIARGMEFLHSRKIYHGELNTSSIFLKARTSTEGFFHAKISGFGLSAVKTHVSRNPTNQNAPSPFIWYAPEVLAEQEQQPEITSSSKYTEKADVYSFAMVCFELLTGKVPFEDGHLQGDLSRNITAGVRPLFPFPSPKCIVNLTKKCWKTDPNQRPSFSSICRILRYIKKFLAMNPNYDELQMFEHPVDYCDIETGFLKRFPGEENVGQSSVSQIPFQMFAYRLAEKERISGKDKHLETAASDAVSMFKDKDECESVEDPIILPMETRSVCCDVKSVYSDVRSIFTEVPDRKIVSVKRSTSDVKLRKGPAGTPRSQSPRLSPLNPCGRNLRMDNQLVMSPMTLGRRRPSRHASDPEIS